MNSDPSSDTSDDQLTPVDDTRAVRRELVERFNGDVRRLAAYAESVTEELREKLGIVRVNRAEQTKSKAS